MPIAQIYVLAGHPRPVLQRLLREVSETYARILAAPVERLQVWVTEIDPELYAVGGAPAAERWATSDRAMLEIPLVRLSILADRPAAHVTALIEDLTAVVARVLGGDPARVRVEVNRVAPEDWGIGGVPASIKRRSEADARRAARPSEGPDGA